MKKPEPYGSGFFVQGKTENYFPAKCSSSGAIWQ